MKLYYGGYGKYQDYTVAANKERAVEQIKNKLNINHLPVEVKEISEIEGWNIEPTAPMPELKEEFKEEIKITKSKK